MFDLYEKFSKILISKNFLIFFLPKFRFKIKFPKNFESYKNVSKILLKNLNFLSKFKIFKNIPSNYKFSKIFYKIRNFWKILF